jgi:hypothetical protein
LDESHRQIAPELTGAAHKAGENGAFAQNRMGHRGFPPPEAGEPRHDIDGN